MNDEARRIAFARPKIIRCIQHYLDSLDFVEVETPVLNPILGGAAARPLLLITMLLIWILFKNCH